MSLNNVKIGFGKIALLAMLLLAACGEGQDSAIVLVETIPAKAKVYLNGQYVGRSPCKVSIVDKKPEDLWERHLIEAQLAGYEPQQYEITYRTGAAWVPETISLEMETNPNFKPWRGENAKPVVGGDKPQPKNTQPKTKPENETVARVDHTEVPADNGNNSGNQNEATTPKKTTAQPTEYTGQSPWRIVGGTDDSDLPENPNELPKPKPRRREEYTAKSPWSKNPPKDTNLPAERKYDFKQASKLDNSGNFQCELRLIRVADGKVITQQSAMASISNRRKLAELLVGRLLMHLPESDRSIAAISLCNRRRTKSGRNLSDEMTGFVEQALVSSTQFSRVTVLNLRAFLDSELQLENATSLTGPEFKSLLGSAKYIVVGGVASQKLPSNLTEKEEVYGSKKRS